MTSYKVNDVFVPGGLPEHTYVNRSNGKLEQEMETAVASATNVIALVGATKSGKTVITRRLFPRKKAIWIDCGEVTRGDEVWERIAEQIESFDHINEAQLGELGLGLGGSGGTTLGLPFANLEGSVSGEVSAKIGGEQGKSKTISKKTQALSYLRESKIPLILDDFHYLSRYDQQGIVRTIKGLSFDRVPVILIGIPHRGFDVEHAESEMSGRVQRINIPSWNVEELTQIPELGFRLLNVDLSEEAKKFLMENSFGNPLLIQAMCLKVCELNGVEQTQENFKSLKWDFEAITSEVADRTGKTMYDRLERGPKEKGTTRSQRKVKDGESQDVYQSILYAIRRFQNPLNPIDLRSLRDEMSKFLQEDPPNFQSISASLGHMERLTNDAKERVLEYRAAEEKLYIIDPFFAFYIKFGQS